MRVFFMVVFSLSSLSGSLFAADADSKQVLISELVSNERCEFVVANMQDALRTNFMVRDGEDFALKCVPYADVDGKSGLIATLPERLKTAHIQFEVQDGPIFEIALTRWEIRSWGGQNFIHVVQNGKVVVKEVHSIDIPVRVPYVKKYDSRDYDDVVSTINNVLYDSGSFVAAVALKKDGRLLVAKGRR